MERKIKVVHSYPLATIATARYTIHTKVEHYKQNKNT